MAVLDPNAITRALKPTTLIRNSTSASESVYAPNANPSIVRASAPVAQQETAPPPKTKANSGYRGGAANTSGAHTAIEGQDPADVYVKDGGAKPDPITPPAVEALPVPAKSAFDIQREQVASDRIAEEKRRIAAVDRAVSNHGLADSGILLGQERQARSDVGALAGQRLSQIDTNESAQAYSASEAEKARSFTAGESAKDRTINKEGLAQAKELAMAGMDIQKMSVALQEKGMNAEDARYYAGLAQSDRLAQQGFSLQASAQKLQEQGMQAEDARYYAGLSQADRLAQKGFDLQASAQELTRQGMTSEDAKYYAGLTQAKILADQGLSIDQQKIKLTEMGMNAEDARYYAGLTQQEKMAKTQNDMDIKKGIIVDAMSKIPVDENYIGRMNSLLSTFGYSGVISQNTDLNAFQAALKDQASQERIKSGFKAAVDSTINYTKSAYNSALKTLTDLFS